MTAIIRVGGARHRFVVAAAVMATLAAVAGCSSGTSGSPTPDRTELTVFAAASLRATLDEIVGAYALAAPGVRVVVSTGSSAALATQIQQGGPADLFLSADAASPDRLVAAGLTDGPTIPFATNALAIVVPDGNPAGITSPMDLARAELRIIAAGEAVPITRYVDQLLENLAALPGYPADFVVGYRANVVSREEDVGAVTAKVVLGEADAAIVYETDAAASGLTVVPIPEGANVRAIYGAVVIRDAAAAKDPAGAGTAAARALLAWIIGPDGRAILARHGFGAP